MKSSKNLLVLGLMAVSLILLMILETAWLKYSYRIEYQQFNRETGFLFRNTVLSLQDSMIRKNIILLPADSNITGGNKFLIHDPRQDVNSRKSDRIYPSLHSDNTRMIQVIVINEDHPIGHYPIESLLGYIRPVLAGLPVGQESKKFVIDLSRDSINTDTLKSRYQAELHRSGIQIPFKIFINKDDRNLRYDRDTYHVTPFVSANHLLKYAAGFENTRIYIAGKILPQIIFSIILTSLIVVSYYFMFRNMRANQRLMDLKNDFISNITHELKTPVATVSVAIEALQNFNVLKDPGKTRQYLEIASRELSRLNLMTDKILSTGVFEYKGVEFKAESVDLRELISKVSDSMKLVIDKRKAHLNFNTEGENFRVSGSPVHLMNVVYNLLDNALKYGHPGMDILISLKSDVRMVEFSVKDNGMGIAPEYQKKIFEKFTRVPSGDIHNSKGYGLGLNYVKEVIESHHGTISLVSKPGSGSIFTIRIPKPHE